MKTRTLTLPAALAAAALIAGLASAPAHAQALMITSVNPSAQTTVRGGLLTFSATVKNTSTATYYFLGDNADFTVAPGATEFGLPASSPSTVVLDDTPFTAFYGTSLAPNASFTYPLFTLSAGLTSTVGVYTGYFTLQGGTDPNGVASDLTTQNFQATIQPAPTPEPSQTAALGLGVLALAGLTLKARRRQPIA